MFVNLWLKKLSDTSTSKEKSKKIPVTVSIFNFKNSSYGGYFRNLDNDAIGIQVRDLRGHLVRNQRALVKSIMSEFCTLKGFNRFSQDCDAEHIPIAITFLSSDLKKNMPLAEYNEQLQQVITTILEKEELTPENFYYPDLQQVVSLRFRK